MNKRNLTILATFYLSDYLTLTDRSYQNPNIYIPTQYGRKHPHSISGDINYSVNITESYIEQSL